MTWPLGHSPQMTFFRNTLEKIRLGHAYRFTGMKGIGKRLFSTWTTAFLLCTSENKPCGQCRQCRLVLQDNHPDVHVIEPAEGKRGILVGQTRDMIDMAYRYPMESSKKIIIIDDADTLNVESGNSILKLVEEPPAYIFFIFIIHNEDYFLPTLKSRTQKLSFSPLDKSSFIEALKNQGINEFKSSVLFLVSQGSPGIALELSESVFIVQGVELLEKIVNTPSLMRLIEFDRFTMESGFKGLPLESQRNEILSLLRLLAIIFNQALRLKTGFEVNSRDTELERLSLIIAEKVKMNEISSFLKKLFFFKKAVLSNATPVIILDNLLLEIPDMKHGNTK